MILSPNFILFLTKLIPIIQEIINNSPDERDDLEIPFVLLSFINLLGMISQIFHLTIKSSNTSSRTWSYRFSNILSQYSVQLTQVDLNTKLSQNWTHFFWLTGEIPPTFNELVNNLNKLHQPSRKGRKMSVSFKNQILLTMIWIRRYVTFHHLAMHFGISVSCVHRIIHRIVPILHVFIVPNYIQWHSDRNWNDLAGEIPHWPRVVAIIDGTPFRISKPSGRIQRLFWRKDRHCFFLNWIVIADVHGMIVYSRPGFCGHLHDSTCFRHLKIPPLPAGLQIMADQGFANRSPLLVPISPNQVPLRGIMKSHFKSARSLIERTFGMLKFSYAAVGMRRWRNQRHFAPILCNVAAGLNNRRAIVFSMWKDKNIQ